MFFQSREKKCLFYLFELGDGFDRINAFFRALSWLWLFILQLYWILNLTLNIFYGRVFRYALFAQILINCFFGDLRFLYKAAVKRLYDFFVIFFLRLELFHDFFEYPDSCNRILSLVFPRTQILPDGLPVL